MRTKQLAALLLCLLYSVGSYASHIALNFGSFGGGLWDTEILVSVGPNSNVTALEDGIQVFESSPTGTLSIYLNQSYSGVPVTVGVDFSSINFEFPYLNLDPLVLALENNPTSTNTLSHHRFSQDEDDFCFNYPSSDFCANFNSGNSSVEYGSGFQLGTVEAGLDIVLNLGFISFANTGNGNTFTVIDYTSLFNETGQISLFLSAADGFDNTEAYIFDSNPVPLPTSIWLLLSGCTVLFGFSKRTNT